jgi:hypothetical protein
MPFRGKNDVPWGQAYSAGVPPIQKGQQSEGAKQGIPKGEVHCTIDLLFDWFGLVCFAKKKNVSSHIADSKPNRRSKVQ